jgi:hypothetical protein
MVYWLLHSTVILEFCRSVLQPCCKDKWQICGTRYYHVFGKTEMKCHGHFQQVEAGLEGWWNVKNVFEWVKKSVEGRMDMKDYVQLGHPSAAHRQKCLKGEKVSPVWPMSDNNTDSRPVELEQWDCWDDFGTSTLFSWLSSLQFYLKKCNERNSFCINKRVPWPMRKWRQSCSEAQQWQWQTHTDSQGDYFEGNHKPLVYLQ